MNDYSLFLSHYDDYLRNMGDQRVRDWFLMQQPLTVVMIVLTYLCFCNWWGPRFMKNRKPYELKSVLLAYNALNVALSVWLVHECLMGGWWGEYNLNCAPMDYSDKGMRMARMSWVYFLCKILELLDTVFFVLRKKDSQITYLHLYHHSVMPVCTWLAAKLVPGGHVTSGYLLNALVHVVMYSYYLLAALGPAIQKYLWWKKHVTSMQLIQFVLMVVHQCQLFVFECDYPRFVPMLQIGQAAYFFYLFSSFYIRSYSKTKSPSTRVELSELSNTHSKGLKQKDT